jgi:hypothetical protein
MSPEEIQNQINNLQSEIETIKKNPSMPDHQHTGFDVSKVKFSDLSQRKIYKTHTIIGTMAATAGNYGVFFINQIAKCYVSGFWEVHQVAGTDGLAVTLDLEKLTSGQAPNSGVSALASALNLKSTANTVQSATLTETSANKTLSIGDRLCLKDSGVLTAVNNVTVFVELTII